MGWLTTAAQRSTCAVLCGAGLLWLGGCAAPAVLEVPQVASVPSSEPSRPVVAPSPLQALDRQLDIPVQAPQSYVPQARYDIASADGEDGLPWDGLPDDAPPARVFERGGASWYGMQFHQRKTASGERFDMGALTAAHRTLPFGSQVCVRSLVNGLEVLVRINDRGPFAAGRVIDLSRAAAEALGMVGLGIKQVSLTLVEDGTARCNGLAVAADRTMSVPTVRDIPESPPARRKAGPRRARK
jgi:rare lipoprotein A